MKFFSSEKNLSIPSDPCLGSFSKAAALIFLDSLGAFVMSMRSSTCDSRCQRRSLRSSGFHHCLTVSLTAATESSVLTAEERTLWAFCLVVNLSFSHAFHFLQMSMTMVLLNPNQAITSTGFFQARKEATTADLRSYSIREKVLFNFFAQLFLSLLFSYLSLISFLPSFLPSFLSFFLSFFHSFFHSFFRSFVRSVYPFLFSLCHSFFK
ncbi:unnamed protein product [Acanthosepion pharaonis]|uniref:Uncharacterized protein n=1 Tax=Acanthosepion pharaonis TaxID=158019 RepID=A0A812EEI3_ACAPH|nr:unnamed protein product [Sepia pharaonis]